MTAADPYTLRIEMKHAIPGRRGRVANYAGGFVVSREAVEERGDAVTRAAIGTGPFAVSGVPSPSLPSRRPEGDQRVGSWPFCARYAAAPPALAPAPRIPLFLLNP